MSIQCSKDTAIRIYIVKVLKEIKNLMINFPEMHIFHQHINKKTLENRRISQLVVYLFSFQMVQSFCFSNWYKTLFAALAETKMKALK